LKLILIVYFSFHHFFLFFILVIEIDNLKILYNYKKNNAGTIPARKKVLDD